MSNLSFRILPFNPCRRLSVGLTPKKPGAERTHQCTACELYITETEDAIIHPLIKCLICRGCSLKYGDGDFASRDDGVDQEGYDNHCRWCLVNVGLVRCRQKRKNGDQCKYAFCLDCIERNVPNDPILEATYHESKKKRWVCYSCDKSRITPLVEDAQLAIVDLAGINRMKKQDSKANTSQDSDRTTFDSQTKKLPYQCTACEKTITRLRHAALHPLLKCLVCRECRNTYGTGDFENFDDGVDVNGDDNFCRWCCDGGTMFGCATVKEDGSKCHFFFCFDCIKRNVPDEPILTAQENNQAEPWTWYCFACDKSKLNKVIEASKRAIDHLKSISGPM